MGVAVIKRGVVSLMGKNYCRVALENNKNVYGDARGKKKDMAVN